ncbi:hypothetical protein CV_0872 [Chromobacterium violaceum ATCC 12472]|uniref:Uncharacterized protein n=1 Tax=Chromobacterium violaceum (strain ATCC 12472 / DSM 30191 / JCM 1249 / CCUG 213 / NBRC 12614 / NCIMB 9131 / NCTC 9757 / MK) TaxID=243365 RepID=Q7NZP9_CHRVO|nr:hypothetical protein CV_0872 [Chromobacterium violaceum ATCC 12472]
MNDDGQRLSRGGAHAPDVPGGSCPHSRVGPVLCKSRLPAGQADRVGGSAAAARGCRNGRLRPTTEIMMLRPTAGVSLNFVRHIDPNFQVRGL